MEDDSGEGVRSRRERKGSARKQSRFDALKKLKETRLSGKKNSYECGEVENVYDIVEEKEYAKRVRERREEDWIVDDDGGYVEDGREVFDEEENDEEEESKSGQKRKDKRKGLSKDSKGFKGGSKGSIKSMLLAMPSSSISAGASSKEKSSFGNLDEDEILGELLDQVKKPKAAAASSSLSLPPPPKRFKGSPSPQAPSTHLRTPSSGKEQGSSVPRRLQLLVVHYRHRRS
ncbi:DNA polymerase [Caligus rogercresseyi]|uniref:DNA polymerase n=1 Tax=Caligus rogercresseyi TaxID=217165 RepID=A0A7T8HHI9_CALRO|nr:DNA polymerase [Caligus rogercresseyi]